MAICTDGIHPWKATSRFLALELVIGRLVFGIYGLVDFQTPVVSLRQRTDKSSLFADEKGSETPIGMVEAIVSRLGRRERGTGGHYRCQILGL